MKNSTKILNLLTTFMAVIGICAATLVGFIVIYTNVNGGFSPTANNILPENISASQADNHALGSDEIDNNHTLTDSTEPLYPEPSSFTENSVEVSSTNISTEDNFTQSVAANAEQISSSNNQYQATTSPTNSVENETIVYEHDIATDNSQNVEPVNRYSTSDLDISLPDNNTSENLTGIENNFNTYNNINQQQTTDDYVLNTNTYKFHFPGCDYVKRISPENYATSTSTRSELISQGYDPCGHCNP